MIQVESIMVSHRNFIKTLRKDILSLQLFMDLCGITPVWLTIFMLPQED